MFKTQKGTGALQPLKDGEELKIYKFDEIVASADIVDWKEKRKDEWRSFPILDQHKTSACVAYTIAKLVGILEYLRNGTYIPFSPAWVYNRRINKTWGNGEGMVGSDAFEIVRKNGITLYPLLPSEKLTEAQINALKEQKYYGIVANAFKIDNYVAFNPKTSFEQIASTIQKTGKGVMVWFTFASNEWGEIPKVLTNKPPYNHSVTAVDFTLFKGKKYLVIEDSWGIERGIQGRRLISEEWFKERNNFSAYPISFKYEESEPEKYIFTKKMQYGDNNLEVTELQKRLQSLGHFPANVQPTGMYGSITADAVLKFQISKAIDSVQALKDLKGWYVGDKTLKALNS